MFRPGENWGVFVVLRRVAYLAYIADTAKQQKHPNFHLAYVFTHIPY
jgi:hypothetical protein